MFTQTLPYQPLSANCQDTNSILVVPTIIAKQWQELQQDKTIQTSMEAIFFSVHNLAKILPILSKIR
ncbi:hypothetical protein PCC7424_5007 [Gloeothece citriformis PCC 7424]|uniref:Uncharacterized protein n=1 Tax=Gloeothece citriformis (strain PCC 7424) TaxID=65393 RepID=B7KFN5_GLOC7|nr:hypothetical protein [Gloeothece citriformis]ACK73360.1 hypothetical protein PCC7424_5007 [Gloeothece citriformis PCC 7424]